jgi:hypothetical protein
MPGDDKVGWGAVNPAFLGDIERKRRRMLSLSQRLRESIGSASGARRVRIWQEIRDLDVLPGDQVFHLIAWELGFIASDRHQKLYSEVYEPQIRALYDAHGMDYDDLDADWDDAPEELNRLNDALGADEDRLREEVYRDFGEAEMADLWRNDREEFERRFRNGQEMAFPGLSERLEKMRRGEISLEEVFDLKDPHDK